MKKRIFSLLLTGVLATSMVAAATMGASAIVNEDGTYTPGDNVEETNRYYFAMPQTWESSYSTTAGVYWWTGTDACGALDGTGGTLQWPGYKAYEDETIENLFYIDCPTNVGQVVWNNYVDGGLDKDAPIYTIATQSNDAPTEFYSDGDTDLYDSDFFEAMQESYDGDQAALGTFADNFFDDAEYGLSFNMNNMIFVIDPALTSETVDGKLTYVGEWYFYLGDGEYGSYPTKEDSQEKGVYGTVADAVGAQDIPATSAPADSNDPAGTTAPVVVPDPDNNNATSGTEAATTANKTSTSDTASNNNSAVQTGAVSLAVVLLVILSAVSGVVVLTRKKFD